MKKKVNTDLSKLSNIPEEYLDKLSIACGYIIGNAVYESILASQDITELDVGFGTLLFKNDLSGIKAKFIPSDALQNDLKNINEGGEPTIKAKLEKALSAKLISMYKEII